MEDNYSSNNAMTQSSISDELRFMTDGFADWVDRRERRRQTLIRSTILVAAVTVTAVALLVPQSTDTFVSGSLQCCTAEACDRTTQILAMI